VAAAPSKAEAKLLAVLANAPKPTMQFIPGGSPRAMRSKEEDPEEVHYPGFDICADEEEETDGGERLPEEATQVENMEAEDEDEEEGSKENKEPYVSRYADNHRLCYVDSSTLRTPYNSLRLPSAQEAVCRPSVLHPVAELELHVIVYRLKWTGTHSATMMIISRIRIGYRDTTVFCDYSLHINECTPFSLYRHSQSFSLQEIGLDIVHNCSPKYNNVIPDRRCEEALFIYRNVWSFSASAGGRAA